MVCPRCAFGPLDSRPVRFALRPVVLLASCALACETGSCGPKPTPAVGSQPVASVSASAGPVAKTEAAPPKRGFDLESVRALVDEPALADVRKALFARDPKGAAAALRAALDGGKIAAADLDRARFLLGRLAAQAKDEEASDAAYAAVSESSPLSPHAALRRALVAAKRGRVDDALALLAKVPDASPFAVDRHFALGDALAAKGDHAGAADAYGAERKGPRSTEALIRYAEEIAAIGKTDDPAKVLDAAQGVRKVRFERPTSSLAPRAEEAEKRCRALLPPAQAKALGAPTPAELATAAQATLDAGKPKDALALAKQILKAQKKGSDAWCRAGIVAGKANDRLRDRAEASDVFGDVAQACKDDAIRVVALYDGAKVALSAKQPDVSRARFAAVEAQFPKHRLADDARLRGALAAIDAGAVEKGEAMLSSLPDDYPQGDMRTDALFRLALSRMKKGDWAAAIPFLERSLAIAPREEGYFVAGRVAYFLGRAKLETGAVDDGLARLRAVIVEEPLTFAAAMAYARLSARSEADAARAKSALAEALAAEPSGELFDLSRPELETAAFGRAVELARVGESDLARRELAVAGLLKDAAADPEGQWIAAALFARVGDARSAHAFPRGRVNDWSKHHPGGKWRAAWEIAFPRPWAELVDESATREGVPSELLWAVMREESAFDPDAVSPSAAYGLMQIIVPTAAAYAKPLKLPSDAQSLLRPDVSVPIGASYLKKLRAEFAANPGLAVPSYNAGEGATRRWMNPPLADSFDLWVESIPYEETRKYTKRVLASYWAYVAVYQPARLDAELRAAAGK